MEGNGNGNRPTPSSFSSRLSPDALPFSLNPFTCQPYWSSLTKVDPLSNFTMEGDHESKTAVGAVFSHNLSDFGEDAGFTEYPSANAGSEFGFMPLASNEGLPNYTELSSYGHSQAGFSGNKNASSAYDTLLRQGKPAVKGLKPYGENSEKASEKCSDLAIGRGNPFISRTPDQVGAGLFSFSAVKPPYEFLMSVTSSTSMLQNSSQTQLPYTPPAVTLSHRNSQTAFCENGKIFDSYTANSTVCHSRKHNVFPALVLKSSDSSTTVSPLNPDLFKNVDFKGNFSVNNYDSTSKCSPSGVKDLYHQISGEGKEIHHYESTNDKGKGDKDGKPASGIGPLLMDKFEPLVTSSNTQDDFSLEHLCTKEAVSLARKLDENDSDLDSPCWKGTLASRQSPFEDSRSLSSESVQNEQEAHNSLNPLAPDFFPRHSKSLVSYNASDYVGGDFSSFRKSESTAVNSFSRDHGPSDQSGSRSSLSINGIGTQSSNDLHELGRVDARPTNSESGPVLKSAEGLSQLKSTHSKRDVLFSKGHGTDQAGSSSFNGIGTQSSNGINELERVYALLNNSDSSVMLNSPEGFSKLLSTHSKKDVPTILNVMHYLSDLFVQNCSEDLDSLNDHNHDLLKHIINNLSMCVQHRAGGKTPISDINLTGTRYSPNNSTELHKVECLDMGFQVTRTKALAVPHEFDYENDHVGCKVNSHVFTERMLDSFSSCGGIGTEKRNDIIQVMGNASRDNHLTEEELDPQALVYKKLWLEAQAELCSLKYETRVLCMQLEMGGRKVDRNKVSGKLLRREMH